MDENVLLNYKDLGEGKALIICHGLLGSGDNWVSIARALSQEFRIILVDLRNHGKSFHSEDISYSAMSEDILVLMDHLDIEHCCLLGHSMGGKLAMTFALEHPDRCDGLIVVDSTSLAFRGGHEYIFETMMAAPLDSFGSRSEIDEYFKSYFKEDGLRWFLLKNIALTDGVYTWKPNLTDLYENYHKIVEAIPINGTYQGKTTIIAGGESDYVQDEDLESMRSFFPNIQYHVVEGAGHWVHAQKPKEMKSHIHSFMKEEIEL